MSESRAPWRRRSVAVIVFALGGYVIVRAANTPQSDTPPPARASASAPTPSAAPATTPAPAAPPSATATATATAATTAAGVATSYDPADYARQVRTRAGEAGVSAQLLMAILYNEAYTPHDPALERAWQKSGPDAAIGIANMRRAAFDEVRRGRDFAGRRWDELPDDRDLAIESAAWYLHDLAGRLPARWPAAYSRSALLALGYNAGPDDMLAFARGARPDSRARSYLDRLRTNWAKAGKAVGVDGPL
ncbi:lytic transglycosylase domain-containing protein [Streptomyces sp. NPDC048297]|uniref:lytic transglycosylase domain-containing protein n=1 Tax=Streptomyces sp. NPDC048297 TaxID=3365531 RepID=UPI00371044B2